MNEKNIVNRTRNLAAWLIFWTLLTAHVSAQGLELPYENNLSTKELFDQMSVLNNNGDANTWEWNTGGCAQYSFNKSSAADDYLVTPALNLNAATYKLTFEYMKSGGFTSDTEKMKIKIGKGATVTELSTLLKDYPSIKNTSYVQDELTFSIDEGTGYYLAFQCYSASYQANLRIRNIKIEKLVSLPGPVTDVTLMPGAGNDLSAEISWRNPVLTSTSTVLSQEDFTKIEIYRDQDPAPIHTVANPVTGASLQYTDHAIPAAGKHSYRIVPYNGESAGVAYETAVWIGSGLEVPYQNRFTEAGFNDLLIVDANKDGKTWIWKNNVAAYESYAKPDDWILSMPLELAGKKVYKIVFKYKTGGYPGMFTEQKFKLMAAKSPDITTGTIEIADFSGLGYSQYEKELSAYFIPEESGAYHIGIRLTNENSGEYMYVSYLEVTEIITIPGTVKQASISPDSANPYHTVVSWTNPDETSAGQPLAPENLTKIEVYRDEGTGPVYTKQNPLPGAGESWTDAEELPKGIHTYHFITYNGENKGEKISVQGWTGAPLQLPYRNELNTQEKFDETIISDNNRDGKSWTWNNNGYAQYNYSSDRAADDYLETPTLELKAGRIYKLSFNYAGSGTANSSEEKMEVLLGTGYSADAQTVQLLDYPSILVNSFNKGEKLFSVEQDGGYVLSFRCYSDANRYYLKLKDILVEEIVIRPGKVTNLSVTPDETKKLKATIAWNNPQVNHLGNPLADNQLTRIEIYRNGGEQPLHSIATGLSTGSSSNWIDETVPEKGKFTYKVIPYNGIYAGEADSTTIWVGNGLELPYENAVASADQFNELMVIDHSGDHTWTWNSEGFAEYKYNVYDAADDYLITPSLNLKAGVRYKLTFDYARYGFTKDEEKMKVLIGKTASVTGLATEIKEYPTISQTDFVSEEVYFLVDQDDDYFISFYCYTERNKSTLRIKNIKIEKTVTLPAAVTDANVVAGENKAWKAILSWTNPRMDEFGETLHPVNFTAVKVYRNDRTEPVVVLNNPTVGSPETWEDETMPANGLYTYRIVPYNGENAGESVSVKTWVGKGLGIPFQNSLDTPEQFDLFSVLDHNGDDHTWRYHTEGYAIYEVRSETGDDYLLTPPLQLKSGVTYKLSFHYSGYNGLRTDKMMVKIGKNKSAEGQDILLRDYPQINMNLFDRDEISFSVSENDDYFLSFYAYSGSDGWQVRVKDLEIVETFTVPGPITNASIRPAEDKSLKATLHWTNPAVNTTNTGLLPEDLTKVEIYRDSEPQPVHSIENPGIGARETWTDENVPATGNHTYRIIPYNEEHAGEAVSVREWIGGGLNLPYNNDFTEPEFNDLTVIDVNQDNKTWRWKEKRAAYESYTKPDDWFITPALNLEKGKQYQIEFSYTTGGGSLYFNKQRIKVSMGTNVETRDQVTGIHDFSDIDFSALSKPLNSTFQVNEDGIYYLGFHLCSDEAEYIYIHSISVKEIYLNITSPTEYLKDEADYQTETVQVGSNVKWEAATSAGWITLSTVKSGEGDGTFTFSCHANSSDMRTGEIVVANEHLSQTITVNQAGAGISNLSAEKTGDELRDVRLTWVAPGYDHSKFNVYRNGEKIASDIESNSFTDFSLDIRETAYCYMVSVSYPNGTESTLSSPACVTIESGIDNVSASGTTVVFTANSAATQLLIDSQVKIKKLDILNPDGKRIISMPVNAMQLTLDASSWMNGVYIVRIETVTGRSIYKLIKN